ncbi:DNA-binding response OmpR family regulator [Scopulibacillus darangshiensis]|uniref:DNA-binding response OmpR family regulator n=1 Tax=Scopulibacillus darangshiensis TaxID=442528 RepID=A0A4R2P929_9BACL|nr:response regulator transcription factor [Scopulibacillus darangshiensis]TCP30561.1 DNA-binding response OmpR family regulator [Scopulibacillus darangshiensis]
MVRIMVVEDEMSIRSFIVLNLKRSGFDVVEAESGEEALDYLKSGPMVHIMLLDVMLPELDGFTVCKRVRAVNDKMGIIMLTAKVQETDKVNGLTLGADDYISKPFSPVEMVARVKSLIRRLKLGTNKDENLSSGPFILLLNEGRLLKNGETIELTPTEYDILLRLMENNNQSLTRDELLDDVWGKTYVGDTKIVDVNIRRLRQKIEDDPSHPEFIKTHWGRGYMWDGERQ